MKYDEAKRQNMYQRIKADMFLQSEEIVIIEVTVVYWVRSELYKKDVGNDLPALTFADHFCFRWPASLSDHCLKRHGMKSYFP